MFFFSSRRRHTRFDCDWSSDVCSSDLEYSALQQEDYMDLYAHLQSLPPLQQQILRMRFGQDLSCSEIATTLGKQENLVRVTLSRSLNLLRKIYRRRREEQESG